MWYSQTSGLCCQAYSPHQHIEPSVTALYAAGAVPAGAAVTCSWSPSGMYKQLHAENARCIAQFKRAQHSCGKWGAQGFASCSPMAAADYLAKRTRYKPSAHLLTVLAHGSNRGFLRNARNSKQGPSHPCACCVWPSHRLMRSLHGNRCSGRVSRTTHALLEAGERLPLLSANAQGRQPGRLKMWGSGIECCRVQGAASCRREQYRIVCVLSGGCSSPQAVLG